MSSLQQNVDAVAQIAGNVAGTAVETVVDKTLKVADNIVDDAKKAKDALDKSLKNIGDIATKNANEVIKDVQAEISNPYFSSCLHKTSLFVSVVLSLFAAKYYNNFVDEKFVLNFVFYLIIIYIVYNSILNMLF